MNDRAPKLVPGKHHHHHRHQHHAHKPHLAAAASTPQQDAYARLYGQMLAPLGLDASSFQLMMPGTTVWDWKADLGFIDPAQYNFCAVIPQWSAAGTYQSTDALFDASYGQFLNCLSPEPPPKLEEDIATAQANLQEAQNQYTDAVTDAHVAYLKDQFVVNGVPSYVSWLTGDGASFQGAIAAANTDLTAATTAYQSLVKECDQNLANAIAAQQNKSYYVTLNNGGTSPSVPNWNLSMTSTEWIDSLSTGTDAVTISYSNSQAVYDFGNSWAGGSAEVSDDFFSLQASGSWQSTDEFYTDTNLSISITAAMAVIDISPDQWYSPVTALAGGVYLPGLSEFSNGSAGDVYMFGQGGILPLVKTGMLVVYNPSITLTISSATYQSNESSWSATGGISIGPFQIDGANGGSTSSSWSDNGTTASITVTDTTGVPKILGVTVSQPVVAP
ncbi:hypothetical protein [Duganella violaceipulchra]|uniref:Uncharacterized protein n=1 Tax=Duganella violaceipulchra TaxID=2849652 RepID=A0AA41H453_9BURK|nr:hypothetical protein [Duganella violaceicalia]MBV6320928.1 hypothetical protein [Duganella violaceicalia]MCP2008360.1 hypothetical protein [Duganella violaceicalia]